MRALMVGAGLAAVAAPAVAAGMTLTSPDFKKSTTMPMAQVCDRYHGANRSPALAWSGEPAGTQSFAITIFDPDAGGGRGFWHWLVFNIPASVHQLVEGAGDAASPRLPPGAVAGSNSTGRSDYMGACPPPGPPHHYQITVYAVRTPTLPLPPGAPPAEVAARLRGNMLATAQIIGLYSPSR